MTPLPGYCTSHQVGPTRASAQRGAQDPTVRVRVLLPRVKRRPARSGSRSLPRTLRAHARPATPRRSRAAAANRDTTGGFNSALGRRTSTATGLTDAPPRVARRQSNAALSVPRPGLRPPPGATSSRHRRHPHPRPRRGLLFRTLDICRGLNLVSSCQVGVSPDTANAAPSGARRKRRRAQHPQTGTGPAEIQSPRHRHVVAQ